MLLYLAKSYKKEINVTVIEKITWWVSLLFKRKIIDAIKSLKIITLQIYKINMDGKKKGLQIIYRNKNNVVSFEPQNICCRVWETNTSSKNKRDSISSYRIRQDI